MKYYLAQTSAHRVHVAGRNRRSLEAVVQDPMVLSQIRENLSAWFEKHRLDLLNAPHQECGLLVEELERANEAVVRESEAGGHDVCCTFFCLINAKVTKVASCLRPPSAPLGTDCCEPLGLVKATERVQ